MFINIVKLLESVHSLSVNTLWFCLKQKHQPNEALKLTIYNRGHTKLIRAHIILYVAEQCGCHLKSITPLTFFNTFLTVPWINLLKTNWKSHSMSLVETPLAKWQAKVFHWWNTSAGNKRIRWQWCIHYLILDSYRSCCKHTFHCFM